MSTLPVADDFFDDVDYVSIISTIKGIYTSDGSMSVLLDFERVLDEADMYAFRNWQLGELVQGPVVKRYSVACMFMWPYKLMPDPRGAKRLAGVGCKIKFKKTKIKVPVAVKNPDDYMILPEIISKEPLGPAVRHGDDAWLDVVTYTVYALLEAEELGITSKNIDTFMKSKDPKISRFLENSNKSLTILAPELKKNARIESINHFGILIVIVSKIIFQI